MKQVATIFAMIGLAFYSWSQSPSVNLLNHFLQENQNQEYAFDIEKDHLVQHANRFSTQKAHAISLLLDSIYIKSANAGSWENDWKYVFGYNALGLCVEERLFLWDGSSWNMEFMIEYVYDAQGNLIRDIFSEMDMGVLTPEWKNEYAYNSYNNETEHIEFLWTGSQWENMRKSVTTYHSDQTVDQEHMFIWISGMWHQTLQTSYVYAAGSLSERIDRAWNGSSWENQSKYVFAYNSNNKLIELKHQYWNGSIWVNSYKEEYTYDSNGFRNAETRMDWTGTSWQNNYKQDRTNDGAGNPLIETFSTWQNGAWVYEEKSEGTFDTGIPATNIGMAIWVTELFNSRVLDIKFFDYENGAWEVEEDVDFYYSNFIGLDDENLTHLKLYPNPFKDVLHIESNKPIEVKIYSMLGVVEVAKKSSANHLKVDVSELPAGMYIIQVNERAVFKMVKPR